MLCYKHLYDLPHNAYFSSEFVSIVHRELCRIWGDFSVDPDGIFDAYLYELGDFLYWSLFILFRKLLDKGVFSELFKLGAITLVLKSGNPSYKL